MSSIRPTCAVARKGRSRSFASLGWPVALALGLGGCRTPSLPGFDTTSTGWELRSTQAIWHPPGVSPGIAGDLLLARQAEGRVLLEFSKGALPVMLFRMSSQSWRLEIPSEGRVYGGSTPPPARSAWLVLGRDLAGYPPPREWVISAPVPGVMRFAGAESGEAIEIHWGPTPSSGPGGVSLP